MRVLHCPRNYAGYAGALARAERSIGLQSTSVDLYPEKFQFPVDQSSPLPRNRLARELCRFRWLVKAVRHFDVVHYHAGETLFPHPTGWGPGEDGRLSLLESLFRFYRRRLWLQDAKLLRALGKRIFITFQGTDARQRPSPLAAVAPESFVRDHVKKENIRRLSGLAHGMFYLNPDLAAFLPPSARFVPYCTVDPAEWVPVERANGQPPLILHAPTNRKMKGTAQVVQAVDRLRSKGEEVELKLVEGLTHKKARALYSKADLLIDQLHIGWYGGVAVEFMALGKPVICYIRESDLRHIPPEMARALPVSRATTQNLADVIVQTLRNRQLLGAECRAFVERFHQPADVAHLHHEAYLRAF